MAKKSLGQHWLTNETTLRYIVDVAKLQPSDSVLEIGPGHGHLTKYLVEQADHVVAVEKDEKLASRLGKVKFWKDKLVVSSGDILSYDLSSLPLGYKIVANIPYYLTGHLLRKLVYADNPPAARSGHRVDAGLHTRNPDRSDRYSDPRCGQARCRDALVDCSHVRKTGDETEHEHAIDARGVQSDGFRVADACERSHVRKIWREVTFIADRYADRLDSICLHRPRGRRAALNSRPQFVQIRPKGIEVDGNRPVRWHDIAHASQSSRLDRRCERNGCPVDDGIDAIGELHHQRGIPSLHNTESVHASARRSC